MEQCNRDCYHGQLFYHTHVLKRTKNNNPALEDNNVNSEIFRGDTEFDLQE